MSLRNIKLAVDRSMRRTDADGHMHVERTHISKANVCPYYGREIPDFEALGLDANRIYRMWRHPDELRAGAASFAGKPLLLHHQPVSVDEHPKELVVGSIGTDVTFDGTYLDAPLSLWTAEGIEAVESEEQRELSPGYRYRADMTSGHTPQGVAFDGIMRDIKGNHLALVREGRTGPDVLVADESPIGFSKMKFSKVMAALASFLPTMKPEHAVALDAALDAELEAAAALDALTDEERTGACDSWAKEKGKAMDALTDEDKADAYKRAAADKKAKGALPSVAKDTAGSTEAATKLAVDTAVAAALADTVTKDAADKLALDAVAAVHALYAARKAVETTAGVVALDTAEAVFRFALDHLKVEHKDTQAPALAALYDASVKAAAPTQVALDTAVAFDSSILGLSHIRKG